jgi:hypothetical protein
VGSYRKLTPWEWSDVQMLYRTAIEDIDRVKHRQWSITYYILITYAAIFFLNDHKIFNTDIWLLLASWLMCLIGLYHLADMHYTMKRNRGKLETIEANLSVLAQCLSSFALEKRYDSYFYYFWSFTCALSLMLIVGFLIVGLPYLSNEKIQLPTLLILVAVSVFFAFEVNYYFMNKSQKWVN